MPTEQENIQYLYLVLTHSGNPTIDWDAVGEAMDLKKGAVSKRWSRLKKSMENGETPSGSVYKFLWLCVKHSTRDKALDWNDIAEKCGTTSGAASKRYSRMKQAFEAGEGPPDSKANSPAPKTPRKATPKKAKTDTPDGEATPTPKRKRASPKKKALNDSEDSEIKPEPESDTEDTPDIKKLKVTTPKATPKKRKADETDKTEQQETDEATPTNMTTEFIKSEIEDELEDTFIDASKWVNDLVPGEDDDCHPRQIKAWLDESPHLEM